MLYENFSLIWCIIMPSCVQYVTGDSYHLFYYIFWVSDYIVHLANDITCSIGLSLLIVSFTFLYVVQGDQLLIGRKSSLDLNWLVGVTPFPWWPILDSLLTYHMELLILNGRTCGYIDTAPCTTHVSVIWFPT